MTNECQYTAFSEAGTELSSSPLTKSDPAGSKAAGRSHCPECLPQFLFIKWTPPELPEDTANGSLRCVTSFFRKRAKS